MGSVSRIYRERTRERRFAVVATLVLLALLAAGIYWFGANGHNSAPRRSTAPTPTVGSATGAQLSSTPMPPECLKIGGYTC